MSREYIEGRIEPPEARPAKAAVSQGRFGNVISLNLQRRRRFRPTHWPATERLLASLYGRDAEIVYRAGEAVGTVARDGGCWLSLDSAGRFLGRHETRLRAYAEVLRIGLSG
jgi:hypothetical protein